MSNANTELFRLTIKEASDLMRNGELSPVELTRACLGRIEATEGRLHSFITLLSDEAMEAARGAEAEIRAGRYRGPMHGIPIALKDLYDTAGIRTTSGSWVDYERTPTEDATTTARLKAAGAILLGKLAMHEFALGGPDWTTPGPHYWRLQQRFRSLGGLGAGHGRSWFLHWRLDTGSGLFLRHRGPQTYLRQGQPVRRGDP